MLRPFALCLLVTTIASAQESVPAGLDRHAVPFLSTRPAPLMPGENGDLNLVLALESGSVFEAGGYFLLRYKGEQGAIRLEQYRVAPPRSARFPGAYEGRLCYDDQVVITLPISVATNARFGSHEVSMQLEADVYDARTAELIGRRSMAIAGQIQVVEKAARPIAPPPTPGDPTAAPRIETELANTTDTEPSIADAGPAGSSPAGTIDHVEPTGDTDSRPFPDPNDFQPGLGGGSFSLLFIAGGALVAIALFVALSRRDR